MTNRWCKLYVTSLALVLLPLASTPTVASEPTKTGVTGTLTTIDGVRVLRVRGTPKERGYACGFLLGDEFAQFMSDFLDSGAILDVDGYKNGILPKLHLMEPQPRYEAELRAMIEGMEAKAGGPVQASALGRSIRYEDLLAANAMGDMLRAGCSSFSAWGPMTEDGHTITGRNMDWPTVPALEGTQIVMVHVAPPNSDAVGWV